MVRMARSAWHYVTDWLKVAFLSASLAARARIGRGRCSCATGPPKFGTTKNFEHGVHARDICVLLRARKPDGER